MKFGYVIHYVNDVEPTIEFYERAFGFKRRMMDEEKKYAELETGATRLAFAQAEFARGMIPVDFVTPVPDGPAPPSELGMVTENVDASYRHALSVGATDVSAPQEKPWGQTVAYVRDLNGTLVEICSPMP